MPPIKIATLGDEPVGAGRRHPGKVADILRRQAHAIRHLRLPVAIVAAAACTGVEEGAADVGVLDRAGFLIVELDEAAARASVAEAFPLRLAHGLERLLAPERRRCGGRRFHRASTCRRSPNDRLVKPTRRRWASTVGCQTG